MAGEIDHAMDLIEQAVDGGFCPYRFINEYRPFLEPLRGTPRFAAIAAKAKQRGEAFR